jgi:hypothetical protein
MLIQLDKARQWYDVLIKRISAKKKKAKVLILVSPTIDSLTSLRIIVGLFKSDIIPYEIIPILNTENLTIQLENLKSCTFQIIGMIFINCVGQIDLTNYWFYKKDSKDILILISDSRRPIYHKLINDKSIFVLINDLEYDLSNCPTDEDYDNFENADQSSSNEDNNDNDDNNNDNNDNNKPKKKTVSIKKQEILNTPKNGKKVESFVKKYINGEVGLNEFIHRNSNKENNENKLFNINEIEDYSNFNSNENNSLMRLTYNNSFNNFLNQKNYRNNINSFFFLNNQNSNSGNYEYDNNNEINELNKNKFYQRIKQLNFQNKSFSEIPMKNHKVSSDKILESKYIKIKKYNEVDSENINEEEPKKINLIKHKMNNSLNSEDIKNFASRSYSVFPKLPKRKSLNNVFKMPRSYSEEEDKNRIGLPYNNPNLSNYTFQSPNINLKKIEVNNLNADMFKSIDGDNSYFNKNNSSVSFIGNSIQVIHSKKNKKIKIENKNDESKYDEKNKKKKDFLNLSNRLNEGKEIGKYVNQIKDNITHFIVENKEEDDFLNRKIVEKKNYKKIKEISQEKINSYYNIIGNDNSETKYSKLSKILNNIPPKNIPKTNLLLNSTDKLLFKKKEEK